MGSNFLRSIVTPEDANLDIVAVHGLNPLSNDNHAYDTWTANGHMWLQDSLPEQLPNARILLFGYNANVVFGRSTAGVTENAGNLLNRLDLERDDCKTRPIMFIAHSLGGIIVKKALVDAQADKGYRSLDEATLGIVFFGTPHNGSDHAGLGEVAANIARSLFRSPQSSLIESLKKNSFFADELRNQFNQKLLDYWILSFYETRPSSGNSLVVKAQSAVLGLPGPNEIRVGLDVNHSDLCKFSSNKDDAYLHVSKSIVKLAKQDMKRSLGGTKKLKPFNTMPTDNANSTFIGREKILEQLRNTLQFGNGEHARAALWGLGGSGKTRIARQYARQLRKTMPETHIFWVYAATEARIRQSYAEIAAAASLQASTDLRAPARYNALHDGSDIPIAQQPQVDIVQLVNSWLHKDDSGHWLVIFDSADSHSSLTGAFTVNREPSNVATPKKESLAHMLPRSSRGAILVTTRNKKLALDLTGVLLEVPLMEDVEAGKLVNTKLQYLVPNQEVHSLVTLLEHLPLALVQAAAYIHKTSITIHKYIDLYNKDEGTQMRLLETDFRDLERDQNAENAVLKTWVLSFEQVKLENPKAANLLSIMSCLDAKSIPESMLQVEIPDSLDFVNALATLKAFALVIVTTSENGETFDVHRMVQLSMQRWLETRQESSSWANRALLILETAYYMLQTDGVNDKFVEYYPHTIAALAIKSKPTKESRWSRAALWYKAGVTLCRDYQNAKAHEKFITAIRLWTDLLGDANFVTLASIMMAAKNLQVLAQRDGFGMQEVEAMLLRASNGFEIAAGPQARESMTAKVCLAELYTKPEEWTKAKEILTSILRQSEDTSDCREELFEVIVDAKSAMVHIYQLEGKFRAAETLQLEVVAFSEQAFTRENFRTRAAIRRLAEIQSELGQHDNAINLLQEVLSLNQRLYGEAHVATFGIIQSLAEVYRKLKRYEESLRILEEFLP